MNSDRQMMLCFSTPLHIVDFENIEYFEDIIKTLWKIKEDGKGFEDYFCWTSPDDLTESESFFPLMKTLDSEISDVFDSIGLVRDSHYFTCMWANISRPGNRHALHLHANSFYSGVLYINAPVNCGNIGFKDPRPASEVLRFDFNQDSMFYERTIEIEPKTGRLILFPSWLYHGTKGGSFSEEEERISLSFNIMPKAEIKDFTRRLTT